MAENPEIDFVPGIKDSYLGLFGGCLSLVGLSLAEVGGGRCLPPEGIVKCAVETRSMIHLRRVRDVVDGPVLVRWIRLLPRCGCSRWQRRNKHTQQRARAAQHRLSMTSTAQRPFLLPN